MKHLVQSFQTHIGERGCHFYDELDCTFLKWDEVFQFIEALPAKEKVDDFTEKLADSLANYDPDSEFLAVQQNGDSISVELYAESK